MEVDQGRTPVLPDNGIVNIHADLNKDEILVGGEDILGNEDHNIGAETTGMPAVPDEVDKYKKIRIRIGTLLKADNVSFLLGAGCSVDAGGITFRNVPYTVEKSLLEEGHFGKGSRKWLHTFYACVRAFADSGFKGNTTANERAFLSALNAKRLVPEKRRRLLRDESINEHVLPEEPEELDNSLHTYLLPINFEALMSAIQIWEQAASCGNTNIRIGSQVGFETVEKLREISCRLRQVLANACRLPLEHKENALLTYRQMLRKVLTRPLNLRRISYFTLNYDTLLEQAADAEGITLVDGFVGTLRRTFRPESYDRDFYFPAQTTEGRVHRLDRVVHLHKLHGSVTWCRADETDDNPFGLCSDPRGPENPGQDVVIFPTPLKYGATLGMPYSEMFRRFGQIVAQPQSVLFVIGYGFGDEHVNATIRQALAIPSLTLVIVARATPSAFVDRLIRCKDKRIWILRGSGIGSFKQFVETLLPDLRDEEVERQVLKTYKALDPRYRPGDDGVEDVK